MAKLKAVADSEGLPFGARSMTYNSRRAQELGKWAEDMGQGEAFHDAAFRAYFAEGLNIHDLEVLREIARRAGLDPEQVAPVLDEGLYAQAVDRDWAYSRSKMITAVPTFAMNGRRLVGAQPYESLARLVDAAATGGVVL